MHDSAGFFLEDWKSGKEIVTRKIYSFERDAFQVLSFYAKKGCDIIDF